MTILLVLAGFPVAVGSLCAWFAPRAVRRMGPAIAAVTLTVLALTVSLATGFMLCVAGGITVAELLPFVRPPNWAVGVLRHALPIPTLAGLAAGAIGAALLSLGLAHASRLAVSTRRAWAAARELPCVNGISVVDDGVLHAFAVPGRHARIVVSTGLLRTLGASERRAVLEHERAHLRHHHAAYSQLARLAAAANPLMRPVARAVDVALEQWADADAADAVGDCAIVAHALGTVSRSSVPAPASALGATQCAVVERVQYLLAPPPRLRGLSLVAIMAMLSCWMCSGLLLLHVHVAIELAEAVGNR